MAFNFLIASPLSVTEKLTFRITVLQDVMLCSQVIGTTISQKRLGFILQAGGSTFL
jgi:hypothetical protein